MSLSTCVLRHLLDEVKHTVRVAPLVVVPRDELDKVLVECNARLDVKDGGVRVSDEVAGDNLLVSVAEDALHWTLRSLLDLRADLLIRRALLEGDRQIDNRNIGRWHAERHACQNAVQAGQHLADRLGGAGARRDDVEACSAATAPVLGRWSIYDLLRRGDGVNGSHQTFGDGVIVVDDLGQWSEAVSCARGIGHDVLAGILVVIDAHDEHRCVAGGSRYDDLLGTALNVQAGLVAGREDPGRLNHKVCACLSPWDCRWVLLRAELDVVTAD
mmetsp:Transcript_30212/g.78315  ORF Transcript_30212/g.78315 Transcript_30212/m.78315 type:complete len:272 (+) Transcript_30212:870-1685(+)